MNQNIKDVIDDLDTIFKKETKITVVDAICGAGKSSYAIQKMNEASLVEENFIYITPFLDEVKRVKTEVSNRKFYEPNPEGERRYAATKLESFKKLINQGKDIASTHALFKRVDEETIDYIKYNSYTLILDEVMDITEHIKVTKSDWEILLQQKLIEIDKDNRIKFLDSEYEGEFSNLKMLADSNNLFIHSRSSKDSSKITLLVWCFPIEVFKAFKEVYILTYMFEGQFQKYYYDLNEVDYTYKSVTLDTETNKYKLIEYDKYLDNREDLKKLINIYEGKLNVIGDEHFNLSSSWLKKSLKNNTLDILRKNTYNYFTNILNSKAKQNMWTTIKGTEDRKDKIKSALKYKGYATGFVPVNCRGTNDYRHKENLAYLVNLFMNPLHAGFFQDKQVDVNEELWSLSELIQWMFRSQLRDGKPINLYIPSSRMRLLLKKWLDYKL